MSLFQILCLYSVERNEKLIVNDIKELDEVHRNVFWVSFRNLLGQSEEHHKIAD